MSLSFGGIDITDSIINTEFRMGVLERIVDRLLQVAPPNTFSNFDMEKARRESLEALQKKYPEAGIKLTPNQAPPPVLSQPMPPLGGPFQAKY